ncbi:MAG TPA: quorum-sensing autoinducer CAI-1 synthase [Legionella sp.]|nr:quorum-sensing autoinducer CAI-1 synthase [Legionella sp.]
MMANKKYSADINHSSSLATQQVQNYPEFINKALNDYLNRVSQWQGKHILNGRTPALSSLIFSSNDYLNISHHPQLITAQIATMQEFGNGQMQSGIYLTNCSSLIQECENQFSHFLNYPSSLLSQSGWCANVGLIQSLARPHVPVYLDFYAHMSFWAGAKSAGAIPIPFQHNSVESLQKRLERHGPGIIAVDSVYSTLGTISPLKEYVKLARNYNCLIIVDESHSLGTHGPQGRGLVAELELAEDVDIITASLAKALSGRGGLITGKKQLIELIRYTSLPSIFSSALAPHDLAGFNSSIDVILKEEWRRKKLHSNANYFRANLLSQGFDLCGSQSQIIPIMAGTEANTIWLRDQLEQEDIFGAIFCAPATPKNKTLIRFSINAHHEQSELDRVIECFIRLAHKRPDIPFFKS